MKTPVTIQDEPHDEDTDREPSLGSCNSTADSMHLGQANWAAGALDDREEGNDNGITDSGGFRALAMMAWERVLAARIGLPARDVIHFIRGVVRLL